MEYDHVRALESVTCVGGKLKETLKFEWRS